LKEELVSDWQHRRNGSIRGVLFVLLLGFPLVANGQESATTTDEKQPEIHQPTKTDSELTFSDVMNLAQRFGNRVGENISEATSKTATAIKNATSDTTQQAHSEDPP
jgi:hypothetical protein